MTHTRWFFSFVCLGGMIFFNSWLAFGDMVVLNNGQQIHGTMQLDGILGIEPGLGISFFPLSKVKDVHIHGNKILFFMDDGNWLECHLLTSDLVLETEGLWQIVRADSVKRITLEPGEDRVVELTVQGTKPSKAEKIAKAPLPLPVPQAPEPQEVPGIVPEGVPEPLPFEPTPKKRSETRKKISLSAEMGYAMFLGDDGDILKGGLGYGFSLYYELFQKKQWFIGPDVSFLRSSHTGKDFLDGVTQNMNPLLFGFRAGYAFEYFDLYAKVQLGAVIMDSSGGQGGRSDTVFGAQIGCGLDYRILPWLSAGPELRLTDASWKSSWFSALARIAVRF